MATDMTIKCTCGKEFVFSAGQAEDFKKKGYAPPKRCPACRSARKQEKFPPPLKPSREMFSHVCAACGGSAPLPFKVAPGHPAFCRGCYDAVKAA